MPIQNGPHFHACHMATTTSVKQHKLRKLIAWLSDKEGREKDFISLYIPPEASIDEIVASLKKESDSVVMKSERAEDRLQKTLKNVIQRLKQTDLVLYRGVLNKKRKFSRTELLFLLELSSQTTKEKHGTLRKLCHLNPLPSTFMWLTTTSS